MKPTVTPVKVTNNLKKKDWHVVDTSSTRALPLTRTTGGGGMYERVAVFPYTEPKLPPDTNPPSAIRDYSLE